MTASTEKPCSVSAVNSRRASATTTRSGVSTSRTPRDAGIGQQRPGRDQLVSSSPNASRTAAFGTAPGRPVSDAARLRSTRCGAPISRCA